MTTAALELQGMRLCIIGVIILSAAARIGFCQSPSKENDTLQSLLVEVHQLRLAIQGMTVASQRVQIAVSQMQVQDAAVARATQRADDAHNRCMEIENRRHDAATEVQRIESALSSGTMQESQTKELQSRLAELKRMLDARTAETQSCQAAEAEASSQLQNEQVKLTELRERIERLDRTLEKVSAAAQ